LPPVVGVVQRPVRRPRRIGPVGRLIPIPEPC